MRINEILVEYAIGRFQPAPGLTIIVDSHYKDQFIARGVGSHRTVALILQAMGKILDELRTIDLGDECWVYKPEFEVALGLRRLMDKGGKTEFTLMTVIANSPHMQGRNQVFIV